MNRTTKIILISLGVAAGLTGLFLGIRYYILQKAYNTILDAENAQKLTDNATSDVSVDDEIVPDDITPSNPDLPKGTIQQDIHN